MYISTIIVLTVLCIQLTNCKKDVFCHPNKHEFYVKQIGRCKKCDRCPPGYGYADFNQVGVDMDPVNGAVSCLSCIPCLPGVTFSKFISFRPCRPCRNCTEQGRLESRTCTPRRNARCVDLPKQLVRHENHVKPIKTQKDRTPVKPEQDVFDDNKQTFLLTLGIIVIIAMAIILAVVQFRCRRRRRETRVHQEQDSLASNNLEQAVSRETEVISLDTATGMSSHAVRLLQTNSYSSFPSDFEYELDTLPVRHTSALDTDGVAEQTAADEPVASEIDRNHMTMSDRDIQEVSCHIAANNLYKYMGRLLGVPDHEIQIIEEQNRNNLKESAFQTLKKWQELKGKKATKSELRKVLSNLKRNDLIDKVA